MEQRKDGGINVVLPLQHQALREKQKKKRDQQRAKTRQKLAEQQREGRERFGHQDRMHAGGANAANREEAGEGDGDQIHWG